ncbi:MAG TPA: arginine--tRNA ligase [Rubrobacteraceae bacterium]|nr:arginine--tRNA ligase [Rubrobacteraceae bacterium]
MSDGIMSLETKLAGIVRDAAREVYGVELEEVHVERPNEAAHGDFATNVALSNARIFRRNPKEVAGSLAAALDASFVAKVEVAGPGFINFWLSDEALWGEIRKLLQSGENYGRREPSGEPILLEYVSVNPTGPMTVAHGRHAAYGDSLARILEAAGWPVSREYYFNDGGNQIRLLGESVALRYAELYDEAWPVSEPDALYRGEYIREIAQSLSDERDEVYLDMGREKALAEISAFATRWCMDDIGKTLKRARANFDNYFNEKSLYESGAIEALIEELREAGHVYERDGALWLESTKFGDDKDRVLVKSDGTYTYMVPDIAYHRDKYQRGFGTAVDVLGADHAGYPPRIRAGLVALGIPGDFLDVELVRLVKLVREGEQVKVSKRAGTFVTFDELMDEVGEDVTRYFYVRSSHKTEMNFDLDLAIQQSDENPVFYVQYAHARIASIFERAGISLDEVTGFPSGDLASEERALVMELLDFPRVIGNAAGRREVHPVPTYLETLATRFHQFYTVHRVLVDDAAVRTRRLALCAATKTVLRAGLDLLGVEAPEKM